MTRSQPLLLEQLEDRTAPAIVNAPAPGAAYQDPDAQLAPPPVQRFVTGALGGALRQDLRTLQVVDGQQFHFILSTTDAGAAGGMGVRLTIADAAGRDVFSLSAADGATWSDDVFLAAGRYDVSFTETTGPGAAPAAVGFDLSGWGLWGWGWLGPPLRDTTQQPLETSGTAALPAPSSFFFLPADPTGFLAGATTSPGPSSLSAVAADRAGGVLTVSPLPSPLAAPAPQRTDLNGPPAGPGLLGGGAGWVEAPEPSAGAALVAEARGSIGPGHDRSPESPTPRHGIAVAVSYDGGDAIGSFAHGESINPDLGVVLPAAEASAGSGAREGATVASAPDHVAARAAAPMNPTRLVWALGLGATTLSWLFLLRPSWCGTLISAARRRVARTTRERTTSV